MHSEIDDMDDGYRGTEIMAERVAESSEPPRRVSRGRILVAAVALVAFVGFSWYAYRQATKVGEQGVAPLIAADQGPTRVKPAEPGGMDVPHQDKEVYARMGTEAPASTKVESLLPEPEAPMPPPAPEAHETPTTVASTTTDVTPSSQPPAPSKNLPSPHSSAAAPPPPPPTTAEAKSAAGIAPAAGTAAPATKATKAEMQKEMKTAAVTPPPASTAAATGDYRVQLASLRSEAAAGTEWKRLQKAYPELLSSISMKVQKVEISGKGTFYRVQAGAMSETAAKDLCRKLKQRKAECIVVKS